jgi:hypothetical protein
VSRSLPHLPAMAAAGSLVVSSMKKCIGAVAAIVGLLGLSPACDAAFRQRQTYLPSALPRGDVICDITTGFATGVGAGTCVARPATCNGVADDAQAFADFNSWANLTWKKSYTGLVELYIPSGKTCLLSSTVTLKASMFDPGCASPTTYPFNCTWNSSNFSKGISQFLLNFTGASISAGAGVTITLNGGDGVCHNGINAGARGCSARTATVSSGASQVTLLDTSLCSRFTTGRYAVMTGFATQALYSASSAFGYPPNFAYYDYVVITSTTNCASTGVITFDRPLTNDYKSTWPNNAPGRVGEADQGGPATLYMLPFWWNSEAEYRGGSFDNRPNQTNGAGRSTVYRDVTWAGTACAYPTQAISWTVLGGNWSSCDVEMDKIVVNATFQNVSISKLHFQSSSPRYVTIDGSTINNLIGSSRNVTITNSAFPASFFAGPTGFGAAESLSCANCVISSSNGVEAKGATEVGTVTAGNWSISGQSGGPYTATMTNGIITIPNTHGAVTWATPGSNILWEYRSGVSYAYQVLDVTQDRTNQYVTTSCVGVNTVCGVAGGFPISSGNLKIRNHPAPKFNCTNCTGSNLVAAISNGPVDAPLYSYANYVADVTFPTSSTSFVTLWGAFNTITLKVNNPYAGAGGLGFYPIYQFGGPTAAVYAPGGAAFTYSPFVDLKIGGSRVITSSGVAGGGGTDSLAFPTPTAWYGNRTQPNITSHPAWAGTVNVTIQMDQGVVKP